MNQEQVDAIHKNAVKKGFWDFQEQLDRMLKVGDLDKIEFDQLSFIFYAKQLMMINSEVSELMEALRKDKGIDEVESEAADIFIRLADLYEGLRDRGLVSKPLGLAVHDKINVNHKREAMHGVLG